MGEVMRIFYIFKINKNIFMLLRNNPYNLYKTMNEIYALTSSEIDLAKNMFETIVKPIDRREINVSIFDKHKNNEHYTKYNNMHTINNYYNDETTELVVNSAYLLLKSTKANPVFLKDLKTDKTLFVCDFQNKDYFWLSELKS